VEPKELARAYFEAGDRDDLSAWDAICDPAMTLYPGFAEPIHGLAGIKQFTAGFHAAFNPFHLTIHDLIAEGDTVAARWTTGGTHSGPLPSPGGMVPPTGKRMEMSGMSLVRVANGKIVEERVQADIMGAMQQLGLMPGPA
jgi:predicted ester cyclase